MDLTPLQAISPVDGRYRRQTARLADFFSESALIKYRIQIEVEYFIALCELPLPPLSGFDPGRFDALRGIYRNFTQQVAQRVKDVERVTNHDVKAVEYILKEEFEALGLRPFKEYIHFGLTSQDINNTALPLAMKAAWREVLEPELRVVAADLEQKARAWKPVPMLARTHGQPASPTSLGKELFVFVERLAAQLGQIQHVPFSAKFGGATGNFNAHAAAFPRIDWPAFADRLVNETRPPRSSTTTTWPPSATTCAGSTRS